MIKVATCFYSILTNKIESNKDSNYHPRNHNRSAIYEAIYTEDDDTTTTTGVTVSSIADQLECLQMPSSPESDDPHILFERHMKDPKNGRISKCQNTYFMDGGHRFISVSVW